MAYINPLTIIIMSPSRLLMLSMACVELKTSSRPPLTPMNTPNDFFRVIGSFSMTAASSRTKIGTAVAIMEASTGEERFSPTMNNP